MTKEKKVAKLLDNINGTKIKAPLDKNGNLDIKKYNSFPEVIKVKKELESMGVSRGWLLKKGFTVASLILTF